MSPASYRAAPPRVGCTSSIQRLPRRRQPRSCGPPLLILPRMLGLRGATRAFGARSSRRGDDAGGAGVLLPLGVGVGFVPGCVVGGATPLNSDASALGRSLPKPTLSPNTTMIFCRVGNAFPADAWT